MKHLIELIVLVLAAGFMALKIIGKLRQYDAKKKTLNSNNPYFGEIGSEKVSNNRGIYFKIIKPFFDQALSYIGLIVLLPLFGVVSVFILISDGRPVIFRQKRIGLNGKYFYLHKFRTMKNGTPDIPTHMMNLPEEYIIKRGNWLRKYSLDELPQLYDIFIGEMSIIGPRPALWNQEDLVREREKYGANNIKPGLTGWAQINGRDELSIQKKAYLDGEYVKRMSFLFDLKCFLGTISSVVFHKGFVDGVSAEFGTKDK